MGSGSGQLRAQPLLLRLDTLVSMLLFVGVAMSFLVIVEPAPYEFLIFALGGALLFTRVKLHPLLGLLLLLVSLWLAGGAFALMPVLSSSEAVTYYAVSAYMGVTALIFALALSEHTAARFATLKHAYVLAGAHRRGPWHSRLFLGRGAFRPEWARNVDLQGSERVRSVPDPALPAAHPGLPPSRFPAGVRTRWR